jgi:hypothetical protein
MYEAKRAGKDRVVVRALGETPPAAASGATPV